jgi:hypothetical protein
MRKKVLLIFFWLANRAKTPKIWCKTNFFSTRKKTFLLKRKYVCMHLGNLHVIYTCINASVDDPGPMLWFLKYFRQKNKQNNWRFWLLTKLNHTKIWSWHWFLRKTPIFCRKLSKISKNWFRLKLSKIAENCDHRPLVVLWKFFLHIVMIIAKKTFWCASFTQLRKQPKL